MSQMKIEKYALAVNKEQVIEMPIDADVLDVVVDGGAPHLLARVDSSDKQTRPRVFNTVLVGETFEGNDLLKPVGTFVIAGSVGLVFEGNDVQVERVKKGVEVVKK